MIDRVIDGDTVDVHIDLGFDVWLMSKRVRLWGIDTPENRSKNLKEKTLGTIAREVVADALPVGSRQILISKEFSGKYGRIIGDFELPNLSMCEFLLEQKYAVPYSGENRADLLQQHFKNYDEIFSKPRVYYYGEIPRQHD